MQLYVLSDYMPAFAASRLEMTYVHRGVTQLLCTNFSKRKTFWIMPRSTGGHIPVVVNAPDKVQLGRISHVYHYHPDLDKFDQFARDFGFIEVVREQDTIYYSGYGRDMCIYVARRSKGQQASFGGAAFVAQTKEDFIKASRLDGATSTSPFDGPGGGSIVTITSPSGTLIHVLWGLQEKPVPSTAVSETEVHKGAYNTALTKNRKGDKIPLFRAP